MNKLKKINTLILTTLSVVTLSAAQAGDVEILAAKFHSNTNNSWNVSVTLKHADSGWDHYADNWQVLDADGKILGDRVLYHPHVDEQPFTRSLSNVQIPADSKTITIRAHDKVHGWAKETLTFKLENVDGKTTLTRQ